MKSLVPIERIEGKIYIIRGKKVMLDRDLADLYEVETKYLNRQVRRNLDRFPADFMFQMTEAEFLRCHFVTSKRGGRRYIPYAFTEQGIAMLSSILKSKRAVQVNIQIMRTFIKLRKILSSNRELRKKIESLENKYDQQFKVVFDAIKALLNPVSAKKKQIGFLMEEKA